MKKPDLRNFYIYKKLLSKGRFIGWPVCVCAHACVCAGRVRSTNVSMFVIYIPPTAKVTSGFGAFCKQPSFR